MIKRIFLLIISTSMLVGCGLDSVPQEGLTNAVSMGWDEGVAALKLTNEILKNGAGKVWLDIQPLAGTNVAQVTYRIEMEEDVLNKIDWEAPYYLYGGGLLQLQDGKTVFLKDGSFSTDGEMQLWAFQPGPDGQALVDWLTEPQNMVTFGRADGLTERVEL